MKLALIYIFCAAVFSSVGNVLLKYSKSESQQPSFWNEVLNPYFIVAAAFFFINLLFFSKALSSLSVSVAYPILSSVSFLLLMIGALVFFGEKLTITQYSGVIVICFGIALLASGIE